MDSQELKQAINEISTKDFAAVKALSCFSTFHAAQ
jgi:hypothetical protein